MNEYIEINGVKIPLHQDALGYDWNLALVVDNHVYYWEDDDLEDIALMYSMSDDGLELMSSNYFAYESMYEDTMAIIDGDKDPLYVSESMKKTIQGLGDVLYG